MIQVTIQVVLCSVSEKQDAVDTIGERESILRNYWVVIMSGWCIRCYDYDYSVRSR